MDENSKKVLKITIPIIFILAAFSLGEFYLSTFSVTHTVGSFVASPTHFGFICVSPVRHPGDPASVLTQIADCNHNTYTRQGQNATREYLFNSTALGNQAFTGFNVISLGVTLNGSAAAQAITDRCIANGTSTSAGCNDFTGNGLQPAAGTVASVTGSPADFGNVSITKTFTCTSCVSTGINATGLYNSTATSGSGNNTNIGSLSLFAEANFTTATLQTNDQINVTWFIWTQ